MQRIARGRTVLVADTAVTEMPDAQEIAEIAIEAARVARSLGYEPRLALLAFSTFGHPPGERSQRVQEAVRLLDERRVDFEYDGEMSADVALDAGLMRRLYPFCRLSGPANILIMPELHSANISASLLAHLGGGTVISQDGDGVQVGPRGEIVINGCCRTTKPAPPRRDDSTCSAWCWPRPAWSGSPTARSSPPCSRT